MGALLSARAVPNGFWSSTRWLIGVTDRGEWHDRGSVAALERGKVGQAWPSSAAKRALAERGVEMGMAPCQPRCMLRIGAVVLNVADTDISGSFWASALRYDQQPHNTAFLAPGKGQGPRLHLDQNDRTHLDLWVDTEEEQLAEVDRLIALGAARVDWQYPDDADFVVLADPGGTLFCVIDLSK